MTAPDPGSRPETHTITPHIVVQDAARAAEWYAQVFGASERGRLAVPDGRLMQVELWFGDSAVMLADEFPEVGVISPLSVGGTATVLHFKADDATTTWERAVAAGAEVRQPLQEAFWGELYGQITDPFGHRWGIAQHLREVPPEELERAIADAFGG
jgi:PhnB protein